MILTTIDTYVYLIVKLIAVNLKIFYSILQKLEAKLI